MARDNSDPIIRCEGLGFSYDGAQMAIADIDLSIERGEVVGVIGQNGSGKTTLVKHFNGLLKPTVGRVVVEGVDTLEKPIDELAAHTGYVFQNPNHQLFAQTVAEELAFGPTNMGLEPSEVEARVRQAAEFFQLESFMESHPYRLGFPLRKQVAMASIYAMNPAVIVLDEPTTGQDHPGTQVVHDLIDRLREQGVTIVVVSHSMPLIAESTDRVVVLWEGALIGDGPPADIFYDDTLLEKTHLQAPQITQLSKKLDGHLQTGAILNVDDMFPPLSDALK